MKIKFLTIVFDKQIMPYEIAYFRASVIENTKRKSDLFHNHKSDKEFIYRYPLIQYKIKDRKPAIICINAATDHIHYLLENREFHFDIKGKVEKYEIDELNLRYHRLQSWEATFLYNVHNYMPFNQENYAVYKKLGTEKRKLKFLEECLHSHLAIIVSELNADMPIELVSEIVQIKSEKYIEYKGVFHQTYSLNFKTNISLPNFIGIGKGVSLGFGIVKKLGNERRSN